jgi:pyruvate kinase
MVARGDLGIEVPIETVPVIQKDIIRKCNEVGKPVIVATQMLLSMVNFPVPSRAEVTDVSTAILDGTDAVMLSDETTVGKYPVEAVKMLDKIARSTEKSLQSNAGTIPEIEKSDTASAIARAACRLADYVGAKAIVAPTQTGSTARRVSMYRPRHPVVAICTQSQVARMLKLYSGVIPVVSRQARTVDWLFARADQAAEQLGLAKRGERIVVTSGTPGMKGTTDLIKVSVVGSGA